MTRGSIGVSFQEDLGTNAITSEVARRAVWRGDHGRGTGQPGGKGWTEGRRRHHEREWQAREDRQRPGKSDCASADRQQGEDRLRAATSTQKETTAVVEDRTRVFPNSAQAA